MTPKPLYSALGGAVLLAATVLTVTAGPAGADQSSASRSAAPAAVRTATNSTTATTTYADWPTYHGNGARSGYAITAKRDNVQPTLAWDIPLDGAVYGQPIIVDHGVRIAATENNSVYRLSGNKVVWRRNLGAPVPRSALPCGNIDPSGITGTPAYDATHNTVIVVALLNSPIRHVAYGIDPGTGAVKWSRNVDVPSSVPGISPTAMQQRGALLVASGRVYIPYGGLAGDCSSYRGSVVGLDLTSPTTAGLWNFTVPTSREGGIWTPPGPVEEPGAGLLVAVGNGATASSGSYDYSDSVLELAGQKITDSFSPSTWRDDNAADLDLGSQGPTIVGNFVFIAGKRGTAYVLNKTKLGGIGGQVSQLNLCKSFGGTAVVGSTVFVPCTDGIRAVRISSTGAMTVQWHAASNVNGTPTVGGGRLFALDYGAGVLHVLDPANGQTLWTMPTGAVNRFAAPAIYSNAVYIGTQSGVRAWTW
ncbi:MAG: PQQ-binding-like beta-propeller repeat protein [Actinobacteria bacterium]|nr:PQQ-binding-like beta-propeller repeat protein [Actinomycetota bacterium]